MVRGDDGVAQPSLDLDVALHLVAWIELDAAIGIERGLVDHLARKLEAVNERRQIARRREEVVADARRVARIGRTQEHLAAAVGMQKSRADAEAVAVRRMDQRKPKMRVMRGAAEHELDVGHRELAAI